jgi:hypothetical protein
MHLNEGWDGLADGYSLHICTEIPHSTLHGCHHHACHSQYFLSNSGPSSQPCWTALGMPHLLPTPTQSSPHHCHAALASLAIASTCPLALSRVRVLSPGICVTELSPVCPSLVVPSNHLLAFGLPLDLDATCPSSHTHSCLRPCPGIPLILRHPPVCLPHHLLAVIQSSIACWEASFTCLCRPAASALHL